MVTSCKPQLQHELPCNISTYSLSVPKTNRVLRLVSHSFYTLWARYKNHRARVELKYLNDHLLKDINQPRGNNDPLGKHRAWNDPLYYELRRRW